MVLIVASFWASDTAHGLFTWAVSRNATNWSELTPLSININTNSSASASTSVGGASVSLSAGTQSLLVPTGWAFIVMCYRIYRSYHSVDVGVSFEDVRKACEAVSQLPAPQINSTGTQDDQKEQFSLSSPKGDSIRHRRIR